MKNLSTSCKRQVKIQYLFAAALILCVLSFAFSLLLGSVKINPLELFKAGNRQILLYVRLPRTLSCLVAGAALAVSGAVIQGVFANRLASPGIIGVNSGAGLAVTACTALGLLGGWQIALGAFIGAFAAVMLIALGAKKCGASRGTVILAGVALNSFLNAISTAIVTLSPDVGVMSNDFKVGDFSAVTYARLLPAAVIVLITLGLLFTFSNELDIMGLGEETAHGLGVNTKAVRTLFLLFAALLAGAAVSLAGLLSFVGLIVPHAVRRLGGGRTGHLLPLSALFGGGFVALCDLIARVAFAPYEIPVGIIMAFVGAPFFIVLLIKGKGGRLHD